MSRLAARLMSWGAALLRHRTFRIRAGPARGMYRRFGHGFRPRLRSGLTPEEAVLAGLDLAGRVVWDVGAYIGITSLFFARAVGTAGRVVSFEPNPLNLAEIEANVALNRLSNVTIVPVAAGERAERGRMMFDRILPARGSLVAAVQDTLAAPHHAEVEVAALDELQTRLGLPDPALVKLDVEGAEVGVVRGMQGVLARARPVLVIELHTPLDGRWLADNLRGHGYRLRYVETGRDWDGAGHGAGHHLHAEP